MHIVLLELCVANMCSSISIFYILLSVHSSELQVVFSAIPPIFNGLEVLSSASGKAKCLSRNFSKNSNVDDSGISLPALPSKTNLKLSNISVTLKMVRKVIRNLD